MRSLLQALIVAAISASTPLLAQPRECPVAGTKTHWMVDYCMSTLETDDEIAASSCISAELARTFAGDCEAKVYYKKAMCQRTISLRQRPDDIDHCLADKSFMGSTVRNGGVGGG